MSHTRTSSRDPGFVALHRGGQLTPENHRALNRWARECVEHLIPLVDGGLDMRLTRALQISREWERGNVKTGVCMTASKEAHAAAREATSPLETAIARAIGHAVATAHMADHSLGPVIYGVKAVEIAGKSVTEEMDWQKRRLRKIAPELETLVLATLERKKGIKTS